MATSQAVRERQCPECNQPAEVDGTETVCPECGLVVDDDPVEHGEQEWVAFTVHEHASRSRTGPPTNRSMHHRNLGSEIGYGGDVHPRRRAINRHAARGSKSDSNRAYATTEIQRMSDALDVDQSTAKQAKHLFRQFHDDGGATGLDLDEVAAACVYCIVRVRGLGRSPGDVASVARADERMIVRQHRRLCNDLGIGCPPPDPHQRVRVVAANLGLGQDAVDRAVAFLEDADASRIHSGSPSTLAAGALYLGADGDVTQVEVADAAGCCTVSLRHRAEELEG